MGDTGSVLDVFCVVAIGALSTCPSGANHHYDPLTAHIVGEALPRHVTRPRGCKCLCTGDIEEMAAETARDTGGPVPGLPSRV